MLGNIAPFTPALSRREKDRYSTFYCGLCKTLGKRYGVFSRFLLSYDMAFTAMVYDGINGFQARWNNEGCFANPFKKKTVAKNSPGAAFAADVMFLLAYHKLADNINDEKLLKKAACICLYPYFRMKYSRAKKRQPTLARCIESECKKQLRLEKSGADIDSLRRPTSNMTRRIMLECAAESGNKAAAGQFGFFLGRVIYLLDALLDRPQDEAEGRFNPFTASGINARQAKEECFMALGELAFWYRQLDFGPNKEILDNTIYMSLARKIKFAGEKEVENG